MAEDNDELELEDELPGPKTQNGTERDDDPVEPDEVEDAEDDQVEDPDGGEEELAAGRRQQQQQEDPNEQQRRQPSRGERRFSALTEQIRQRDRELAELRGRMDAFLSERQQQQTRESPEQRAQRLALLTPEDRIAETLREDRAAFQHQMGHMQLQMADQTDKASFEAKCAVDKVRAKYRDAVEEELTKARREGKSAPRDVVYYYLLGKAVDERRSGPESRQQRRAAARRVAREEVRPRGSRGDVPAERRQTQNLERRLENMSI
jgi:hypothetical protein